MFLGKAEEVLEHGFRRDVIGFDDADIGATRDVEAAVHRVAVAGIGLGDDLDAGILVPIFIQDRRRCVGGSVVNADDLDIDEALLDDAVQALSQVLLNVAYGNKDADRTGIAHEICLRSWVLHTCLW